MYDGNINGDDMYDVDGTYLGSESMDTDPGMFFGDNLFGDIGDSVDPPIYAKDDDSDREKGEKREFSRPQDEISDIIVSNIKRQRINNNFNSGDLDIARSQFQHVNVPPTIMSHIPTKQLDQEQKYYQYILENSQCVNVSEDTNGERWAIDPITNDRIFGNSMSHYILKSNKGENLCFNLQTLAMYLIGSAGPTVNDIESLIGRNDSEIFWKFTIFDELYIVHVTIRDYINILSQYSVLISQEKTSQRVSRDPDIYSYDDIYA
jgi:hypothetical protein